MKIVKSRLVVAYLSIPLLIPHLLFYKFSKKKLLIRSDVCVGGVSRCLYIDLFMISPTVIYSIIE